VTGGLFSATLGDGTSFGSLFADSPNLWLEVAVDLNKNGSFEADEVYAPRQKMTGAAWAIEADTLDGQHGAFYRDASNLNAGTLSNARFSAYSDLSAEGYLDNSAGADLLTRAQGDGRYNSFKWVTVTSSALVQALPNRGYMVNSPALATIALPTSATLSVGDVIRVSGVGVGGWKLIQNAGQRIRLSDLEIPDYSGTWTPRESNRYWSSVASSADGSKLVACDSGGGFFTSGGLIYTSWDSGATWTTSTAPVQNWRSIASSADGTRLVACSENGITTIAGQIHTSSNSGATWIARGHHSFWRAVASSANGTKLAACGGGRIYTSWDSGLNWIARAPYQGYRSVASSANGIKLVACNDDVGSRSAGQIYTSWDSGVNWSAHGPHRYWLSAASSADGAKLVACAYYSQVYTSSDSGVTWTARESERLWSSVASSRDGTKLVACVANGQIYTSSDSGATWTARESNRGWVSVASSADGTKLVACVESGRIYTYDTWGRILSETTFGAGGSLSGSQGDAVELQYIGANTFVPLSHEGSLGAQ
jgi:hypothetical protein